MSVRGAKILSVVLAAVCGALLLVAIALQIGVGRGFRWLPLDDDVIASVGGSTIDRQPFKLPPESAFGETTERPLFNEDRKPTPETPEAPVNPPPPRISAGQCRALCYIASLSRSGSWKLDLERRAILTEVGGIIRSELDDQPLEITEHTVIDGIDGWDSVAHVRIIVAIESRFSVRFEPDEYMDFQNVGELVDCLSKKLSEIGHERTLRPRAALRT